jgi:SsrA-binding protein
MARGPGKTLAQNKKARHDYHIVESFEAGVSLVGSEVKSIRQGRVSIRESYAEIRGGEVFIRGMHVSPYDPAGPHRHDPIRPRKLLLHDYEIRRLIGKIKEKGFTLVPLRIYLSKNLIKVEIALARGRRQFEKREDIKRRLIEEELRRAKRIER